MTEKQFELSRYELNRKPQELIQDDTEIKVQRKALNALLMCPICLDVLRSTMTTKECLHRFCAECITTALRSGNKECPTCRKVSFSDFTKILKTSFNSWFNSSSSGSFLVVLSAMIQFSMLLSRNCTHRVKFMKNNRNSYLLKLWRNTNLAVKPARKNDPTKIRRNRKI